MLETEFPLSGAHPKMRRSSSTRDASANANSLNRQSSGSFRKISTSGDPREPLMAPEWQYESAKSMSRIQTSFDRSGSVSREQGVQANLPAHRPSKPSGRTSSLNRSGSLRKACSDESSEIDDDDQERVPLHPRCSNQISRADQTVQTPSSTSDYHSDDIHQHRRTNSYHGVAPNSAKSPKPLPVEQVKPAPTPIKWQSLRHRKHDDDKMSGGALCCLTLLVIVAQILLHGLVGLVLYWVIRFHTSDGASFPFAWRENPTMEFNLHPVLMIVGFIYCSGQAMLFYRSCRCCRRIWNKLFHTMFHLLAIPCIAIGFIAVLDSHNLRLDPDGKPSPIPNFYSLHSWMGLTTMGLFALQFFVGFFSFLLLLCCESATASFRASLVPVHAAFGLTTFVLAVATACTGFTEKAFFTLSVAYAKWVPFLSDPKFNASTAFAGINTLGPKYDMKMFEESLVINVMSAILIGLAMVIPVLLMHPRFRFRPQRIITVTHDRY